MTTNAETTKVLAGWGPTERELKAQVVAAAEAAQRKAAAEKAAAELAAAQQALQQPPAPEASVTNAGWTGAIATQLRGMIGAPSVASPAPASQEKTVLGFSRLGGPDPEVAADVQSRHRQFLRQIHAAACKYFGTVLGPEANDAHKNHLHLDMAERSRSNFCE
jgi:membrane protein involved in colicin uptake